MTNINWVFRSPSCAGAN